MEQVSCHIGNSHGMQLLLQTPVPRPTRFSGSYTPIGLLISSWDRVLWLFIGGTCILGVVGNSQSISLSIMSHVTCNATFARRNDVTRGHIRLQACVTNRLRGAYQGFCDDWFSMRNNSNSAPQFSSNSHLLLTRPRTKPNTWVSFPNSKPLAFQIQSAPTLWPSDAHKNL